MGRKDVFLFLYEYISVFLGYRWNIISYLKLYNFYEDVDHLDVDLLNPVRMRCVRRRNHHIGKFRKGLAFF